jgi:hypothetical protein
MAVCDAPEDKINGIRAFVRPHLHWRYYGPGNPLMTEPTGRKAHGEDDAKLAAEIGDAVKAYEAADTVKKEKAVIAGRLLAEAQKRHPGKKAFENFLELAGGIGFRRAETFIAIALGRKDFEQHRIENVEAQQRHRDKIKAEKIERQKALSEGKGRPEPKSEPKPAPEPSYVMRKPHKRCQPRASASLRSPADPVSRC